VVIEIRIYIEGGGERTEGKAKLRNSFQVFLRDLREKARDRRIRWNITVCGSRGSTHDDFNTACQTHPGAFNVLLVDSEGPVDSSPRQHLRDRNGWQVDESEVQYHLMVQAMEAWLIADREAVKQYYGQGFQESALSDTQDVEQIDKSILESSLDKAANKTNKKEYHKIRDGAKLLGLIDPNKVQDKAPHCSRLLQTLTNKIEEN
jgi:hypothetical protein